MSQQQLSQEGFTLDEYAKTQLEKKGFEIDAAIRKKMEKRGLGESIRVKSVEELNKEGKEMKKKVEEEEKKEEEKKEEEEMKKKEEGQGEKDDEAMEAEIEDEVDYPNKAPQDIPLDLSLKPVQQVICTPDILPKQPVPLRPTPVRLLTPVVYKKTPLQSASVPVGVYKNTTQTPNAAGHRSMFEFNQSIFNQMLNLIEQRDTIARDLQTKKDYVDYVTHNGSRPCIFPPPYYVKFVQRAV